MKVEKLIRVLQRFPQNHEVYIETQKDIDVVSLVKLNDIKENAHIPDKAVVLTSEENGF